MKKLLILAAATMITVAANAQIGSTESRSINTTTVTTEKAPKKFVNALSFYIQDGWGLGYDLRKEFGKYVAWDIFGVSYMSGFYSPADAGRLNLRFAGIRGYSPKFGFARLYANLDMGYTMYYFQGYSISSSDYSDYSNYDWSDYYYAPAVTRSSSSSSSDTQITHNFGLDFGIGLQLGKHFQVGYNLNYVKGPDMDGYDHWCRFSYLF